MFAPPDPSSTAVPLPEPSGSALAPSSAAPAVAIGVSTPAPPISSVPTLPSVGSTPAPTLPGVTPASVPAPVAPAPVAPAPIAPAPIAPAPIAPVAPDPAPAATLADDQPGGLAGESERPGERPAAPAPLLRTGWLRRVVIWASLASVPGAFVGNYVGAALAALSAVALVMWSAAIATSVRRSRPATRHGGSPHPVVVVLSWFVAPVVGVVAILATVSVGMWADAGTFEEEGTRMMLLVVTVFFSGLAVLAAMYQPYRALAKCAKWVSADAGRFRKWFAAPIVACLLAGVVQVLAGLIVLSDSVDGTSSSATFGAAAVWVVAFALPWLAWLLFGSRAMRSLDEGVAHAHGRAVREARDPSEVDPTLVAQVAAASVNVPAVSAPSA